MELELLQELFNLKRITFLASVGHFDQTLQPHLNVKKIYLMFSAPLLLFQEEAIPVISENECYKSDSSPAPTTADEKENREKKKIH